MKISKKLLQVDRVHLEFIGKASHYMHTDCPCTTAFTVYSLQVFSLDDDKVWNNERKRKRAGRYKTAAIKRLSFLLSINGLCKKM